MLPRGEILAWRADYAPWADEDDVEQDLLLTRALCDIFADPFLHERFAFRGGTALHKLHLPPAVALQDIDCSSTNRVVSAHEREVRRRQAG